MNTADKKNVLIAVLSSVLTSAFILVISFAFIVNNPDVFFSNLSVDDTTDTHEGSEYIPNSLQEKQVIEAVKRAGPAVVSIIISKDVPVVERYYEEFDPFGGSPFNFRIPQYRERGTETRQIGGGSGFVVSQDGYIVTNRHVVSEEDVDYTVFTSDGKKYEAEVVAKDPLNDIALVKIDADNLPSLQFANSDQLEVGQSVIAIGNPLLEFSNSVSVGIVSGLSRSITAGTRFGQSEQLEGVIQIDAAINPGNSGGPLLNLKGQVIGVNVAMASAENIGFALPANLVKNVYDSVKEHGKIVRPFLGVRYVQITEALKEANNLSVDYGVLLLKGENKTELAVIPGSPADKAGLEENDIILEAGGKKLNEEISLARIIAEKKVGEQLKLKVLHDGDEKEVAVELEEFKQ